MFKFLSNLFKDVRISIERFFTTFCLTGLLFLVSGYMVIFDPDFVVTEILLQIALTISLGILLCTLGKLLFEKYGEVIRIKRLFLEIGLVLLSALAYPALMGYQDNQYTTAGYVGIMIALFMCIVYFSDTGKLSTTFSFIFKNTVFNTVVCCIITAGTSLSIFAFHSLIYDFAYDYKAYSVNALFIWIVLFLNLSLSAIPRKDTELKIPNLFRVMISYAALPVYLLLIAILYVYLGKILVTLSFPSGQINWFASFASLLFIFFILALSQYENKFIRLFVRFGGYVIIPIIAVQFIAMYIRLSNYGLTTSRYISLVLNIIAFVFAVISLIKNGKYIKHMLLVTAAASLLLTLTPFNVYDIPIWEQTARLTQTLSRNNMISDGVVTARDDISKEDKIKITSAYDYLDNPHNGDKNLPAIIKNTDKESFNSLFGFHREYEDNRSASNYDYGSYYYKYDSIDISGFSRLYPVESNCNDNTVISLSPDNNIKTINYDITNDIKMLYEEHGKNSNNIKMELQINEDKLILTYVHYAINENNELTISSYNGYFLER